MATRRKINKIVKKVEGEGELKYQPREIYFSWSAEVIINNDYEVLEIRYINVMAYDRDGEEINLNDNDQGAVIEAVKKQAEEKALEKLEPSDFDDEEEEV